MRCKLAFGFPGVAAGKSSFRSGWKGFRTNWGEDYVLEYFGIGNSHVNDKIIE
jgi:hypothetical protein